MAVPVKKAQRLTYIMYMVVNVHRGGYCMFPNAATHRSMDSYSTSIMQAARHFIVDTEILPYGMNKHTLHTRRDFWKEDAGALQPRGSSTLIINS